MPFDFKNCFNGHVYKNIYTLQCGLDDIVEIKNDEAKENKA